MAVRALIPLIMQITILLCKVAVQNELWSEINLRSTRARKKKQKNCILYMFCKGMENEPIKQGIGVPEALEIC